MKDLELALKKMGYRRPNQSTHPNEWAKPLGYSLLVCSIDKKSFILKQIMFGCPTDPKISVWDSEEINKENKKFKDYLEDICVFESYKIHISPIVYKDLAFLTKSEEADIICGLE